MKKLVNDFFIYYVLFKLILRELDKEYLIILFIIFFRIFEVLIYKLLFFDIDRYRGVFESFYENVDGVGRFVCYICWEWVFLVG